MAPPVIGLALGSGSARGWAHIGVLRALAEAGIVPNIVCGTSIGALVGAAYADGQLDRLEKWAGSLTWKSIVGLLDVGIEGGLIKGEKLLEFFRSHFKDKEIAELELPFGAVATDLVTGREVWLREGSIIEAVRASAALPGLLTPAVRDGRLLVDGGLVNPVPVSLCRALGANLVIGVDLNWNLVGRRFPATVAEDEPGRDKLPGVLSAIMGRLPFGWGRGKNGNGNGGGPSMLDVVLTSLNIMQVRITRSRLAGDPADAMIRPRMADVALMDFHRAGPAIAEGRRATEHALPALREVIESFR